MQIGSLIQRSLGLSRTTPTTPREKVEAEMQHLQDKADWQDVKGAVCETLHESAMEFGFLGGVVLALAGTLVAGPAVGFALGAVSVGGGFLAEKGLEKGMARAERKANEYEDRAFDLEWSLRPPDPPPSPQTGPRREDDDFLLFPRAY